MCCNRHLVQGKMNFILMPSLKHIALVKVTTSLLNLCSIRESRYYVKYDRQVIEDKVVEKVPGLPLPELLKKQILYFIEAIMLQLNHCMFYLCKNPHLPIREILSEYEFNKLLSVLCWTPQGTVDQRKTVEAFIKDDNMDITKRYQLACNFCLENDIKELWNSLPQTEKVLIYKFLGHSRFYEVEDILTVIWTYDIKGELFKINDIKGEIYKISAREISAYCFAFRNAAIHGNKTATEYFLQKLTSLEREASFLWYAEHIANRHHLILHPDVLCFLLSQMSEEQQVKVFESDPLGVLSCLLDWPWQSFFMKAANRMWDFISEQDFVLILQNIVSKIRGGVKDCNYHKLFGNFWVQGPSTCKKYFIGRCASDELLLPDLFELAGKENITLILKDATSDEKEAILFQIGKDICRNLICSDKWDLLKLFIDEFLSSEDIMIKFKKEFKRHIKYPSRQRSTTDYFTKFFQILNDRISKNSKKSDVEEGTGSPAKRLK